MSTTTNPAPPLADVDQDLVEVAYDLSAQFAGQALIPGAAWDYQGRPAAKLTIGGSVVVYVKTHHAGIPAITVVSATHGDGLHFTTTSAVADVTRRLAALAQNE